MKRGIAYQRFMRNRIIHKKKRKSRAVYGHDWYPHDGQYAKGKIHCSCRTCTYEKYYDYPRLKDRIDRDRVRDALREYPF